MEVDPSLTMASSTTPQPEDSSQSSDEVPTIDIVRFYHERLCKLGINARCCPNTVYGFGKKHGLGKRKPFYVFTSMFDAHTDVGYPPTLYHKCKGSNDDVVDRSTPPPPAKVPADLEPTKKTPKTPNKQEMTKPSSAARAEGDHHLPSFINISLLGRCCEAYEGWDEEFARRVARSYVQFLKLKVAVEEFDGNTLFPPPLINAMWHLHTLSLYSYLNACEAFCGRMIHRPNPEKEEAQCEAIRAERVQTTLTALFQKVGAEHVDAPIWSYLATARKSMTANSAKDTSTDDTSMLESCADIRPQYSIEEYQRWLEMTSMVYKSG